MGQSYIPTTNSIWRPWRCTDLGEMPKLTTDWLYYLVQFHRGSIFPLKMKIITCLWRRDELMTAYETAEWLMQNK